MTIRTDAIQGLIDYINAETGIAGTRGLRFLHEINDFPSFYIHPGAENRSHFGAGHKLCIIDLDVRAYAFTDSETEKELLARQLETCIQQYRFINRAIEEARVTSISTDEGVMSPYGVCDISAQILYRIYKQ